MNTTLFTLGVSWHQTPWLYERLALASEGDSILLIQDGVLALNSALALASFVAKCSARGVNLIALQEDCDLRGIQNKYSTVELIDYSDFVHLVESHSRQVSW